MLTRARRLFALFAGLALLVETLVWLDASTEVWPDRTVAAGALVVVGAWAVRHGRDRSAVWWSDDIVVVAVIAAGWGLGRSGSILVILLAVLQLRSLFGSRASVAVVTGAVVTAFLVVVTLHGGTPALVSLASATVVTAGVAVVVVLRLLREVLARHDLETAWHEVLSGSAVELLAATSHERVDAIRRDATERIDRLREGQIAADAELAAVRRRLDVEVVLAQERIGSEQRYRLLAEHNRDGIYLLELEPEVAYRYANPAAGRMLGVPPEEIVADPYADRRLMHPADRRELVRVRREHGVLDAAVEVRFHAPDGSLRWVELQEHEVGESAGSRVVLGTLHDVTQRHHEQEALRRALEHERTASAELREVDEMKSTFLRAVSHELRTPLTAVLGAAETLHDRHDLLTAYQRRVLLGVVDRQANRLERLLGDLLDVDRLTRGHVAPHRVPTRVRALVERIVAGQETRSHPITVSGPEVTVALDAPKVERIVDNLLRNAIKHTPAGTAIGCEVTPASGGAQLVVEDRGPGIPDDLREGIFAPFTQGPGAGDEASPGTGIGLSLVAKLAELHGGSAHVDRRPGGGCRFVVELPGAEV